MKSFLLAPLVTLAFSLSHANAENNLPECKSIHGKAIVVGTRCQTSCVDWTCGGYDKKTGSRIEFESTVAQRYKDPKTKQLGWLDEQTGVVWFDMDRHDYNVDQHHAEKHCNDNERPDLTLPTHADLLDYVRHGFGETVAEVLRSPFWSATPAADGTVYALGYHNIRSAERTNDSLGSRCISRVHEPLPSKVKPLTQFVAEARSNNSLQDILEQIEDREHYEVAKLSCEAVRNDLFFALLKFSEHRCNGNFKIKLGDKTFVKFPMNWSLFLQQVGGKVGFAALDKEKITITIQGKQLKGILKSDLPDSALHHLLNERSYNGYSFGFKLIFGFTKTTLRNKNGVKVYSKSTKSKGSVYVDVFSYAGSGNSSHFFFWP